MKEGLKDKLLASEIAFFSHIASVVEPFLTEFESDKPMAPFLYSAIDTV